MTTPDPSPVPESTPKPTGSAGPSCAGASGSRLTTREITDGLEYIATSPAPEYGGFHPNAVRIAQGALEEIARLRGIIARNAMQRLDDTKFHITAEDISSSIEIAADYRERPANDKTEPQAPQSNL